MGLCETIYSTGPPPVFGTRALGLFLGMRLTLTCLSPRLVGRHT